MDEGSAPRVGAGSVMHSWPIWERVSAALALMFGALTVAAFIGSSPGWARLELAIILGPLWVLFAVGWLVALALASTARPSPLRRSWPITPAIVAVALALTVAGVGLSNELRGTTASIDIDATVAGTRVDVRGTTDLPEGSRVSVSASHGEIPGIFTYAETRVRSGAYQGALHLERWPNGPVTVAAAFAVDGGQPAEAIKRFGPEGEHLSGPGVHWDSDGPVLSASVTVQLRDGLAADDPHALKAPATLMGTINDANGESIGSATVQCIFPSGHSPQPWDFAASSGGFYMCTAQPGEWEIRASAPGYRPASVRVTVQSGDERELAITLEADAR